MHKIKLILVGANPTNALSVSNLSVEMETPQGSEEMDTESVSTLISSQVNCFNVYIKENFTWIIWVCLGSRWRWTERDNTAWYYSARGPSWGLNQLGRKKSANEAVNNIAEYIAKKLCNKVEGLTSKTTAGNWIKLKNRESLSFPSKELVESIHRYEEVFVRLHGENMCRQPDPMGRAKKAILKIDRTWQKLVVDLFLT